MWPVIGAGISAGTKLIAGSMADDATAAANATAARQRKQSVKYQRKMDRKNIELQKQFAQQSIRWKVADAEAAGIHPLYALGNQATSFAPVSVGGLATSGPTPEIGMANALAESGQDISRAIQATRTVDERAQAFTDSARKLQLQNLGLQNELLASQLSKINSPQVGPPMPNVIAPNIDAGPMVGGPGMNPVEQMQGGERMKFMGIELYPPRNTSSYSAFSNWLGDEMPGSFLAQAFPVSDFLWTNSLLGRYYYGLPPFNR